MKNCSRCQKSKSLSEFNKNDTKEDGLQSICKECNKEYQREWYQKNKEIHKSRSLKRGREVVEEARRYIEELKESTPCADCGQNYPYYVMDFDHLRDKKFAISTGSRQRKSLEEIKREIEKCDIVCANCHRHRTHQRLTSADGIPAGAFEAL